VNKKADPYVTLGEFIRRQRELAARGSTVDVDEILRAQHERDQRDAARAVGPMVPAADAIVLDSTALSVDQVVERMAQEVRKKTKSRV